MAQDTAAGPSEISAIWLETLTKGHAQILWGRKFMRLLPGHPRCKVCHNPFGGIGGRLCGVVGIRPSRKNPKLCSMCCEKLPPGGAEIEIAVLFADIRGSTALAERIGPAEFAAALNEFYAVATRTLIDHEATVDKLIGDEVMAFFVPGFSGPAFKHAAVESGQALLRALGYGGPGPVRLPVGIGIDAGIAYVGNVGGEGYVDFTALGDPVNSAARIQAEAAPGELLVGEAAFAAVADRYPECETRLLDVKGKPQALHVRSVPLQQIQPVVPAA